MKRKKQMAQKSIWLRDTESDKENHDEGKIIRKTFTIESIPETIYEEDQIDDSLDRATESIMRQINGLRNEGWIPEEILGHKIHIIPINKN